MRAIFLRCQPICIRFPRRCPKKKVVFLPNMETAVNFLVDKLPLIGERVVVFGQGVVGLLTAALLVRLPLSRLITVDGYPFRRERSLELGVACQSRRQYG